MIKGDDWKARAAALLSWSLGLGFGVPGVYGTWYFAGHGEVWTFLGFPTYGDGPFESMGIETSTTLLTMFSLVCLAELVAGWLLWRYRRSGAIIALALLPLELAFWIGFALPLGLVMGLARTALISLGWPAFGRAPEPRSSRPGAVERQ
jgi:hypothetical protein